MPAAPQRGAASTLRRLKVTITDHQQTRAVDLLLLRRIVKTLLGELRIGHSDLAIHLVAAPEITRLNETFLHHHGSTDVITFDYRDGAARNPQHEAPMHGEIFVCLDEAVRQARRFRTTWQTELVRYIVHGVLHLLGFDDLKPTVRSKMKRAEDRWLRLLARRFPPTKLARHGPTL